MPTISHFFGIIIRMYYNDHEPPHFHAVYAEHEALIVIETLALFRGDLPRRALALVLEWALFNRTALLKNWELAREGKPLEPIPPLD